LIFCGTIPSMDTGYCRDCKSPGNGKCRVCSGTGINVHLNSDRQSCENCGGSGACPTCQGSGRYGRHDGIQTLFGSAPE
jgi:hypothetical protein